MRQGISDPNLVGEEAESMFRVLLAALLLAGVAAIATTLIFTLGSPKGVSGQATLQAGLELAIDADADNGNGPCNPVDDEASVDEGAVHRVAVCVLNPPVAPYAFLTRVTYDGQLNLAPEVADVSPALDDNPDANAGETTFSDPDLGENWDCTGLTVFPPAGDDTNTPDVHDAVLACNAALRNPNATLDESGPLEVITFQVVGQGDDHIEFDGRTHLADEVDIMGRCGVAPAAPEQTIPCRGAVIHKGAGAQPTTPAAGTTPGVSPEATSETPAGASPSPPTGMATQPATPEQTAAEAGEGGGFPWAVLFGALGGAVLLIAAATVVVVYIVRRA
jgi:hypothetical protein